MSHIPSHAMPHAKPHEDESQAEAAPAPVDSTEPSPESDQTVVDQGGPPQAEGHQDLPTPIPVPAKRDTAPPWAAWAIGGVLIVGGAVAALLASRGDAGEKKKAGRKRKGGKRSADKD